VHSDTRTHARQARSATNTHTHTHTCTCAHTHVPTHTEHICTHNHTHMRLHSLAMLSVHLALCSNMLQHARVIDVSWCLSVCIHAPLHDMLSIHLTLSSNMHSKRTSDGHVMVLLSVVSLDATYRVSLHSRYQCELMLSRPLHLFKHASTFTSARQCFHAPVQS
jgi:hypothetical protein